jgi:hypothetical protein
VATGEEDADNKDDGAPPDRRMKLPKFRKRRMGDLDQSRYENHHPVNYENNSHEEPDRQRHLPLRAGVFYADRNSAAAAPATSLTFGFLYLTHHKTPYQKITCSARKTASATAAQNIGRRTSGRWPSEGSSVNP